MDSNKNRSKEEEEEEDEDDYEKHLDTIDEEKLLDNLSESSESSTSLSEEANTTGTILDISNDSEKFGVISKTLFVHY